MWKKYIHAEQSKGGNLLKKKKRRALKVIILLLNCTLGLQTVHLGLQILGWGPLDPLV